MINLKRLTKILTKNLKKIPLLTINLNYRDFQEGIEKYCFSEYHPAFKNDDFLKTKCQEIVDHIRKNYGEDDIL
jgi:hypothetical protein